jgi:hypothetical protein
MQGRLFGLMAIGKKESSQMDHKIGGTAVTGVLNLGNVLELVDDGLNDGSSARPVACRTDVSSGWTCLMNDNLNSRYC